jgi:hypothetical protein
LFVVIRNNDVSALAFEFVNELHRFGRQAAVHFGIYENLPAEEVVNSASDEFIGEDRGLDVLGDVGGSDHQGHCDARGFEFHECHPAPLWIMPIASTLSLPLPGWAVGAGLGERGQTFHPRSE